MEDKKEKRAKFNPELQPKSHVLKVSYWIGADEDPDWVFDEDVKSFFKELGYSFCGSGFDFAERRRDIEFKKK